MEKDDEVKGVGNSYTTEFRQYDPRIARWTSIDPVIKEWESPYASYLNNPIFYSDPSGADPPEKPKENGEKEADTQTTEGSYSHFTPNGGPEPIEVKYTQNWYWHTGSEGHEKGWYKESDYFDEIMKPLAQDLNNWQDGKSDGGKYFSFILSSDDRMGLSTNITRMAEHIRKNPTVDGWQQYMPLWGSGKQAYLDYSVGKSGWGIFNTVMAVSDVFLLKSIIVGGGKFAVKGGVVKKL